jgi:hypothetical protein
MKVVGLGTGAKSMMSLWLLNPSSLARRLCLLRLTKKIVKPMVQASRTQAPETDPAMIGVLAFCLDHNRRKQIPSVSVYSNGCGGTRGINPRGNWLNTHTHGERRPLKGCRLELRVGLVVCP